MSNLISIVPLIILVPMVVASLSIIDRFTPKTYTIIAVVAALLGIVLSGGEAREGFILWHGLSFALDQYSMIFVVLVNVCWIVTAIYSYDYLNYNFPNRRVEFQMYLSLAVATVLGTGMAENMFTLILFYSLSGFLILVILSRFKRTQQKIILVYTLNVLIPALVVILPTCIYLQILFVPFDNLHVSNLNLTDVEASLLLAGFIIFFSKNCVFPFHTWLPKTSFAPAPVSALVHSVGAVQTGAIAVLKIGHHVYGGTYLAYLNNSFFLTGWITYLCGFTAVYTAYMAWKSTNLKERFSYSTVGQISYILSAILIGTPSATLGAILHIVTHSLAKITLFFNAGILSTSFQATSTTQIAKIAPSLPLLVLSTGIAGLSISGFPFLAGYYSKDLMLLEEIHTHHYAAAIFLVCGSLVNLMYIFPILKAGYWPYIKSFLSSGKEPFPKESIAQAHLKLKPSMVLATTITTISLVLLSIYININLESIIKDF